MVSLFSHIQLSDQDNTAIARIFGNEKTISAYIVCVDDYNNIRSFSSLVFYQN